ncbi:hypothetical protein [Nonomuraea ferruginea]|uniref:Uncharacterized protein n=1 Tax=Nonomuraea ferruginea TaxID=46174 RepID=A0ABT4SZV2_9ACTN|nr:hypothetical protein [Nonomuraea ferruginea]MDA0642777.1 hypothetical protein [Nonomuraea ferruginea]
MEFYGERFSTVALPKYTVEVASAVDQIGEGSTVDVESGHTVVYGCVEVAAPGVNDAEIYVCVGYSHGRVGRTVRAGVHLDSFAGVFFGAVVVGEPGVAGGGIEHPLGVVKHEVVVWVFWHWKAAEHVGSAG